MSMLSTPLVSWCPSCTSTPTSTSRTTKIHQLTLDSFIAVFMCTPVSNYWVIGSPEGSCFDEGTATLICGIINCVADFATTVTPIPLILGVSSHLANGCTMLTQHSFKCRGANATLLPVSSLWESSSLSQVSSARGISTSH